MLINFSLILKAQPQKVYNLAIKNNQIFLNNKQITKSLYKKSYVIISPDKKKILFICNTNEDTAKIGIVDIQTKTEKYIKFNDEYTQVMSVEWLNNLKVGVKVHINPSLDSYSIYDIASGKVLGSYFGYDFKFNNDKSKILYIQEPPHNSTISGEYTVMLNDASIYKTDAKTQISSSLYTVNDFKRIAFYESNSKDETKSNIVILTLENNKIKTKNKIVWNKKFYELKWSNENILLIGNIAKYDVIKAKLKNN